MAKNTLITLIVGNLKKYDLTIEEANLDFIIKQYGKPNRYYHNYQHVK